MAKVWIVRFELYHCSMAKICVDLKLRVGNWDVVRRQFGLLKRENKALETRWRVMQRSVSAGRYKNERVVSLIAAIKQKNTIPEISSGKCCFQSLMLRLPS